MRAINYMYVFLAAEFARNKCISSLCLTVLPLSQVLREGARDGEMSDSELKVILGAIEFLDYFDSYWVRRMTGWRHTDRISAARAVGVDISAIPTTTNHAEGFNTALKDTHLKQYVYSHPHPPPSFSFLPRVLQRTHIIAFSSPPHGRFFY